MTALHGGHYHDSLVFAKMNVSFTGTVAAGWRRSETFALKLHLKDFYYFAVPT